MTDLHGKTTRHYLIEKMMDKLQCNRVEANRVIALMGEAYKEIFADGIPLSFPGLFRITPTMLKACYWLMPDRVTVVKLPDRIKLKVTTSKPFERRLTEIILGNKY